MDESVLIPMPFETVQEAEEEPSLTYRIDFEKGRILGKVDGLDAVEQAIQKVLMTPRFKCLIYDGQYGSEIEDVVIAGDASQDYIQSTIEGFVRDALKPDSRILSVSDFTVLFDGDEAYISFRATTIYGDLQMEEVISDV